MVEIVMMRYRNCQIPKIHTANTFKCYPPMPDRIYIPCHPLISSRYSLHHASVKPNSRPISRVCPIISLPIPHLPLLQVEPHWSHRPVKPTEISLPQFPKPTKRKLTSESSSYKPLSPETSQVPISHLETPNLSTTPTNKIIALTTPIPIIQITIHSRTRLNCRRHAIRPIHFPANLHIKVPTQRIVDGDALAVGECGYGLGFAAARGHVGPAAGVREVVGEHEVGLGVGWGG